MRTSYSRPSLITVGVIVAIGIIVPTVAAAVLVLGQQAPPPETTTAQTTTAGASTSKAAVSTVSTTSPGPCAGGSAYTGLDSPMPVNANASLSFPILSVRLNYTAEICVAYTDTNPLVNDTIDLAKGVVVGTFGTKVFANGTVKHPFIAASNITVTPNQTKIALGGTGPTKVRIAYTITMNSSKAKGFYFLNIAGVAPVACNDEFRLAVGYNFTQSNSTGKYFPIPAGFSSCSPSGGTVSSSLYEVKGVTVVPLMCEFATCDLNETG